MILGCVLAGGQSSRFGSDKALAEFGGHTLIARAVDLLSGWCEHVIVAGRPTAPAPTVPDWPHPGMGPLGGIAAALHYALDENFEAVLTCGVDTLGLPEDLSELLAPAPAYVVQQPIVGLWPARAAVPLEKLLSGAQAYPVKRFAEMIEARPVKLAQEPANINTKADLAAAERNHGI